MQNDISDTLPPEDSGALMLEESAPVPKEDDQSWTSYSDIDRAVLLQKLIVNSIDNLRHNNPTLHVWAPPGEGEKIAAAWKQKVDAQVPDTKKLEEGSDEYLLYYPKVVESEDCLLPILYTAEQRQTQFLEEFYVRACGLAGQDPRLLAQQVGLDLPTLKSFYLSWILLVPGVEKLFTAKGLFVAPAAEAKPNRTPSGLIVPGGLG